MEVHHGGHWLGCRFEILFLILFLKITFMFYKMSYFIFTKGMKSKCLILYAPTFIMSRVCMASIPT